MGRLSNMFIDAQKSPKILKDSQSLEKYSETLENNSAREKERKRLEETLRPGSDSSKVSQRIHVHRRSCCERTTTWKRFLSNKRKASLSPSLSFPLLPSLSFLSLLSLSPFSLSFLWRRKERQLILRDS